MLFFTVRDGAKAAAEQLFVMAVLAFSVRTTFLVTRRDAPVSWSQLHWMKGKCYKSTVSLNSSVNVYFVIF